MTLGVHSSETKPGLDFHSLFKSCQLWVSCGVDTFSVHTTGTWSYTVLDSGRSWRQ